MNKKLIVIAAVTSLIISGFIVHRKFTNGVTASGTEYTTAPIERGEIITTITSTGTLEPVATVDVGTQVSGIINKLYVDFNDPVEKGQLIAELDRTVLSGALDEAVAARSRSKALFDLAEAEYKRNEPLFKKGFISEQEFIKIRTDYITQKAALQSSEASLKKARTNLQYATITSPITGTVIARNIEVGQTVAASFSAPTLFVIAEDLKRMKILASVDEADIGGIYKDQEVRFTVQAFSDKNFTGVVKQVRLQPTVTQNVVTYTVVIETENSEGILLPGMTATVDFVTEKASDVLKVPNAALRFQPEGVQLQRSRASGNTMKQRTNGAYPRSGKRNTRPAGNNSAPEMTRNDTSERKPGGNQKVSAGDGDTLSETNGKYGNRRKRSTVWVLSEDKTPRLLFVKTGITDGSFTEIHSRKTIAEGTMVITGVTKAEKKKKKTVSLLPQPRRRGRH